MIPAPLLMSVQNSSDLENDQSPQKIKKKMPEK
jgi:hypothetical protein